MPIFAHIIQFYREEFPMNGIRTFIRFSLALSLILSVTPVLNANPTTENVASIIVDDFNTAWSFKASGNVDNDKTKIQVMDGGAKNDNLYPSDSQSAKKCMAFKSGFLSRGFNYVEFYPAQPILLPGKARAIQLWILGMKYRWNLEVWVVDYQGFYHKIDFGSMYFEGWQSITKIIPSQIPQQDESYPKDKPLKIVKMVVRSDPNERIDRFYFAIDQIKVVTDIYQEAFDGMDLINKSW